MLFHVVCIALSALAAAYHDYHDLRLDVQCDTTISIFYPWSGFRVVRHLGYQTGTATYRLLYCHEGAENFYIDSQSDTPQALFDWSVKFCHGECYKMAPLTPQLPLYRPDALIGGLFVCSEPPCEGPDVLWEPLEPLLGDEMFRSYWTNNRDRYMNGELPIPEFSVPLAYSPGDFSAYTHDRSWVRQVDWEWVYDSSVDNYTSADLLTVLSD